MLSQSDCVWYLVTDNCSVGYAFVNFEDVCCLTLPFDLDMLTNFSAHLHHRRRFNISDIFQPLTSQFANARAGRRW